MVKQKIENRSRLAALILAAGESKRLGQPKQLVKLQGVSLIERVVQLASPLVDHTIVVLGAYHDEILTTLPEGIHHQAVWTVNQQWQQGQRSSIALGVKVLERDFDAILILTVDQWRLARGDLMALIEAWRKQCHKPVASKYGGSLGVPAIFTRNQYAGLVNEAQSSYQGAKSLLMAVQANEIDMPNANFDLDTPKQLFEMLQDGK